MHDEKLPYLSQAVDPEGMAARFEDFFRHEYPGLGLTVSQCQVSLVYHKADTSCDLTYRLLGQDYAHQPYDQWLYATMLASGTQPLQPRNEPPATWPGCGFWHPVCLWPDMHLVLYACPYDPKLPYLGQLFDSSVVTQHVEANLAELGFSPGWQCQAVTCQKVKYMPGRRCLLRYDVLMADTAGQQRRIAFYSKTHNRSPKSRARSRYVYEALRQLCGSPACTGGLINIPGPIAYMEETNTLWQHAWEGKELTQLGAEVGWTNLLQTPLVSKIASMLAALHQIKLPNPSLRPHDSPKNALREAYRDAADIPHFLPEKRAMLTRIMETLTALAPSPTEQRPHTTMHGSFQITQILCRDDQMAVIDFDGVAYGDPLHDVARFLASLVYLRVSDRVPTALMAENVERFVATYQVQVPWACDRQRLAWYVMVFLLGKMHSSLKRLEATTLEKMALVQVPIEKGRKNRQCGGGLVLALARPISGGRHAGTSLSAPHCH